MPKKKILFICGSLNQTTMMHKISLYMQEADCYFSPYYGDRALDFLARHGILNFSILGGHFKRNTLKYIEENNLKLDYKGLLNKYDMAFTCSDLMVPHNIRDSKLILVQEGMTDPEVLIYYLVKYLKLPRWLASTSTTGLSDLYDKFFVASEEYKKLFMKKGVKEEKIVVTGIPNFDDLARYANSEFEHKNFVLVATSDSRETFKVENRAKFLRHCVKIANGRPMIFKLHPNELVKRATREINKYAPGSLIYSTGNINYMIPNCDVLITQYSTVSYIGLALNKEVHSYFDVKQLKKLMPIQNGGKSAEIIAKKCLEYLNGPGKEIKPKFHLFKKNEKTKA